MSDARAPIEVTKPAVKAKPIDGMWRYVAKQLGHADTMATLRERELAERVARGEPRGELPDIIKGLRAEEAVCHRILELFRKVEDCREEIEPIFRRKFGRA